MEHINGFVRKHFSRHARNAGLQIGQRWLHVHECWNHTLGSDYGMKWLVRVEIPKDLSSREKRRVAGQLLGVLKKTKRSLVAAGLKETEVVACSWF
jgi:hypothetical protein